MPFTPFHMGPGVALKALAGPRFSVLIFGFAQVLIDVEPLVRILRGDVVLHGATHTYLGALVIAGVAAVLGRPLAQAGLTRWRRAANLPRCARPDGPRQLTWGTTVGSALVGTLSHVALDSVMHADMAPLAPVAPSNDLLGVLSLRALHLGCVAAGALGAMVLVVACLARPRRERAA